MFKKTLAAAAAAAATLFVIAGCDSMGMKSASAAPAAPAMMTGGMLVAPSGMTLYTFDKDTANSGASACNGPCAQLWPPLMAQASDTPGGDYTIVTRADGGKQWAYKGWPLYSYAKDAKAGDAAGDKFKDVWHVVKN
jgi:predicted lipoprotein with Yx(FWY)xxD motif